KRPVVTITAKPASPTSQSSAEFAFSADDPTATFACSLDSAAFDACTSPIQYTGLAEGAHAFAVRATDAAGNTGPAASFGWTVDLTAPTVTLDSGPADPSASSDAVFAFSSDDSGATFACSLDGAPYAACASPVDHGGLADGAHAFAVRAADAAG